MKSSLLYLIGPWAVERSNRHTIWRRAAIRCVCVDPLENNCAIALERINSVSRYSLCELISSTAISVPPSPRQISSFILVTLFHLFISSSGSPFIYIFPSDVTFLLLHLSSSSFPPLYCSYINAYIIFTMPY